MPELQIRKFLREDFPEYRAWFADAELNRQLGPMEEDDEWLDVLNQEEKIEYSIVRDEELLAVVGIQLPSDSHPYYYITDLAVKPSLRGQGIGSISLQKLLELHPLKPAQKWRAFVDAENPKAKTFFEKNNWVSESETADEHGMLSYTYDVLEAKAP